VEEGLPKLGGVWDAVTASFTTDLLAAALDLAWRGRESYLASLKEVLQ